MHIYFRILQHNLLSHRSLVALELQIRDNCVFAGENEIKSFGQVRLTVMDLSLSPYAYDLSDHCRSIDIVPSVEPCRCSMKVSPSSEETEKLCTRKTLLSSLSDS